MQGDVTAALSTATAVQQRRIADPETHPFRRFQSDLDLAAALRADGRVEEAAALLDAIDTKAVGANLWQLAWVDQERARILAARGEHEPALKLFVGAEAQIATGLGAQHPDAWLARIDRAEVLALTDRDDEARRMAREIARNAAPSIAPDGYWARRLALLSMP